MSTLLEVLISIFPIFVIILIGYLMQNTHWFGERFASDISKLIMKIALPASIFTSVISHLSSSQLSSFAGGLLIGGLAVVISYSAAFCLCRALKVRRGRRGIFINTFANANTVFIGMPMNLALFGEEAQGYFLIYYVLNTISTWAFGSFLITGDPMEGNVSKEKQDRKGAWKQILSPPLIAFFIAIVLVLLNVSVPAPITTTTQYLGNLVTPLALIYIGIVLCNAGLKSLRFEKDTVAALFGKFMVAPAAMILVLTLAACFGYVMPDAERNTLIMQSAMPALTVQPILANEGKGDVQYATGLVALSTILFIAVAPVMMLIINAL